jgi:predicted nucleic acid-binding protein
MARFAVTGAGLAGAGEVAADEWIEVRSLQDTARSGRSTTGAWPGIGEVSAIVLAVELLAEAVLMDDRDGRRADWKMGVDAIGCVGVLEEGFPVEADSRFSAAHRCLFMSGAFVSQEIPEQSFENFNLQLLQP